MRMRISSASQADTTNGRAPVGGKRCFWSDESGTLIIFSLMLLVLMIMMGGIAVDIMRYESRRTSLQNALDRATLAAAALNQSRDPKAVVNDYFLKAGLAEYLTNVTVTESSTSKTVTAKALANTQPMFLRMLGINAFDAPGVSTAVQKTNNVEIMLVLDVSGSMDGAKLTNLKLAATDFIDTVLTGDTNHHISVGIVPYNAQVNLGATLRGKFNATYLHNVANVNCLELPGSVFTTPEMSMTQALPMMAYADILSGTNKLNGFIAPNSSSDAVPNFANAWCVQSTNNIVRLPSNNIPNLKAQINGLTAAGNTSIVLGLKWGEALLDPSMRQTYSDLIGTGDIPATLPGRPFDYNLTGLTDSMKVIVLMTDGEHVPHNLIADTYKTGPSPIYKSIGDGNYSIRFTAGRPAVAGANEYWVPHLAANATVAINGWKAVPWDSGSGAVQQNWQDIWANLRVNYVAWQLYARALGTTASARNNIYNTTTNTMVHTWKSAPEMDSLLQQACTAARAQNVTIYGIAFQASTEGQTQIRDCSTDGVAGSHYFNATTLNIATAFQTIASNISQLRLTQ